MSAPAWLLKAAQKSLNENWSLGSVINRYCLLHEMPLEGLAAKLGCTDAAVFEICLCRRPSEERFIEDVTAISARAKIPTSLLAQVVREVEASDALKNLDATEERAALLLAARDRKHQDGAKK